MADVIAPSNVGIARLTVSQKAGRSVVTDQYSQAPLQLHRPLYLESETFPTIFLKTPSAGLLAGDSHIFNLIAGEKSTIKICNQAATLVYPGFSKQTITIEIKDGATVYFEPCPLILAARADLKQVVHISMGKDSRLRYVDEWSAGRIAMNEYFAFSKFDNKIEITVDGQLRYRERFVLAPLEEAPTVPFIAGNFTRFKSVFYFGNWALEELDAPAQAKDELVWRLQRPGGTIDRYLSAPLSR